jgi:two-component system sensor histidine kinase VicK
LFKSIQWKLVSIYILLILLAMEVVGAYLVQSLEKYHVDSLTQNLDNQAQLISGFTERYFYPIPRRQEIENLIQGFINPDVSYIVILDESGSVIFSTDETRYVVGTRLWTPEITQATFGSENSDIRQDAQTKERHMYLAHPVKSNGKVVGIIYLIASMEKIYDTLGNIKALVAMATVLALGITGFLGYALSKTITGPIQEVTRKAALMAQGDFDQKIPVKSNDEIGKLTDMFNFLTTQLKDTLEQISDEKGKMEAILTNMADGVIALNSQGEVIHINPAAAKMLSLDDDYVGKNLASELEKLFKISSEDFLNEDSGIKETIIKSGDAILKAVIAPLRREARVIGLILVLQDITKENRLENMRKEFVANVSHELRTPLATIKSYAETLLDGALEEPDIARQFTSVVNNEADRMTRLVNDLLELSRLDNKETRWDKRPLKISRVLTDVVSKMKVNATKKNQQLELHMINEEEFPETFADRDKMEQVFQNILSNAIKYTPEGGKIRVSMDVDEDKLRIIFADSGIGIHEKDLSRIFERFYRVDKTRSREMGGTGLGLSIAKEIVEAHGGKISIESRQGEGTRVSVMLPSIIPA